MAEDDDPTADEFAKWLTPRDALHLLHHLSDSDAKLAIFNRLQHGLVQSAAKTAKFQNKTANIMRIANGTWRHAESGILVSSLWKTADITIDVPDQKSGYAHTYIPLALFGVRFDSSGLVELLPPHDQRLTENKLPREEPEPADEEPKGPPVSSAHLEQWYRLYEQAYQGADDTEANALVSARGMFPGKSVSRDRVRELRGSRRHGRKKHDLGG
ncbi:MAG TPA: hypothetical protein VN821_15575 [Candidatus Udaeobacter sp.]|nr:hypothetical protein [Candidatus Udaeobacter sp.]